MGMDAGWRVRIGAAVAALAVVGGLVAVFGGGDDDGAERVEVGLAAGVDETTTSDPDPETTSTTAPPTTTEPTPQSTTTTTEVPPATDPSETSPTTTSSPAAPPPSTAPPTTAPQSTTFGAADAAALRSFVAARHPGEAAGFVATGEAPCPAEVPEGDEPGDNALADVTGWDLMRTCDGRVRLRMVIADAQFDVHWMEVDSAPGGCRGVDLVAIAYFDQQAWAGVVATPGCSSAEWRFLGAATWPYYNDSWLELHFGLPSGVGSIRWQAFVRGRGEGAAGVDAVPNAPHTFRFG